MAQQEAAEKYADIYRCPAINENEYCKHDIISAFNNGAKWQMERSYSEEDMKEAFNKGFYTAYGCKSEWIERIEMFFNEWFEQFKK